MFFHRSYQYILYSVGHVNQITLIDLGHIFSFYRHFSLRIDQVRQMLQLTDHEKDVLKIRSYYFFYVYNDLHFISLNLMDQYLISSLLLNF